MTDYDIINIMLLAAGGVVLPVAFAFHVFLNRSRAYAAWAKLASIIICLGALAWGGLDWALLNWRSLRLTHEVYDKLVGIRGLLGGVCIGIALSISLAQSYRKDVDKPQQAQSARS